jgi:hypothetical protein
MSEWHYSRSELANQYLQLLNIGITSSIAIIAPRRKGKTLFILQDLAPLAQKHGFIPVYASLWQNVNAPHEGLISALEDAISVTNKHSTIGRILKTKISKTTVSNELLGKMEVEFADNPSTPYTQELNQLDKLLGTLIEKAGKKTVLLLIDEVQHLATSSQFGPLTHTLRTMLDKRQGQVKSVFTGSSRHYLDLLLNESRSPLYHFTERLEFPDLDDGFIEFLNEKISNEHGIETNTKELRDAFDNVDRSPYWMMKLVIQMVTFKATALEASEHVKQLLAAADDFEGTAKRMKPIDRIVFVALCKGESPYTKEMLRRIGMETDVKGIAPNVQRSIKRLSESGLISQTDQTYNIEKPGLRRYIEQNYQTKPE